LFTFRDPRGWAHDSTVGGVKFDRRLATALLSAAGVLVTHEFAYSIMTLFSEVAASAPRHSYLTYLWAIVGPLAGLGVSLIGIRKVRTFGRLDLDARSLAACIGAGYLALEFGERLVAGTGLAEAAMAGVIWVGALLVVPVAYLLVRAVEATAEVLRAVLDSTQRLWLPGAALQVPQPLLLVATDSRLLEHSVHRRGPPVRV